MMRAAPRAAPFGAAFPRRRAPGPRFSGRTVQQPVRCSLEAAAASSTAAEASATAAPRSPAEQQQQQQPPADERPPLEAASGPPQGPGGGGSSGGGGGGGGSGPGGGRPSGGPLALLLGGVKARLAADPEFLYKLGVECGLDAAIILAVNAAARRDRFLPELEFTLCQLAISLLSDFALVYLLAPCGAAPSTAASGTLRAALAALPAHVAQRGPPGGPAFSAGQRAATLGIKALQYGTVGLVTGIMGAGSVQGLVALREWADPGFVPPPTVASVAGTGAAWGLFMATTSNVRYNLVNAAEDVLYAASPLAGKLGSVALRLANNWAGAAQWVGVTRLVRLEEPWRGRRQCAAAAAR